MADEEKIIRVPDEAKNVRVLIVSNDREVISLLTKELSAAGYEPLTARDAEECFQVTQEAMPDLVILDAELPLISGFTVASLLRKDSKVPLIMLSPCVEEMECVRSLEIGAEDCVTKPIRPREFMLRVRNVLVRYGKAVAQGEERLALTYLPPIYEREFVIDPNRHQAQVRGKNVHLTPLQFRFLLLLANHPDRVFTHEALLERVWGDSGPHPEARRNTMIVLVRELRRKIEEDPSQPRHILSCRGVGYQFRF